jgi:hypothetical protein
VAFLSKVGVNLEVFSDESITHENVSFLLVEGLFRETPSEA